MTVQFLEPLANAKDYPVPVIKGLPSLKLRNFNFFVHAFNKQIIDTGVFTQNARNGLALIGQQLNIQKGDTVLLPAYHCPALVEPFLWLDAKINFYHLNKDLSINMEDFENKIDTNTKACVIVRFFGFTTNLPDISHLAKAHGISVIEDWAHCFFGQLKSISALDDGDFAVASCNKFFPSVDGGMVWGLDHGVSLKPVTWQDEIKSFVSMYKILDNTVAFLKKRLSFRTTENTDVSQSFNNQINYPEKERPFRYFVPENIDVSCFRFTKIIIKYSNFEHIIKKRRKNFHYLLAHLDNTSVGSPLYNQLSDETVPYVFPFILNEPEFFSVIKNAGLAIFRWEELAHSNCSTSEFYRERMIQLPCHQDLTQKDLEHIVEIIKNLES